MPPLVTNGERSVRLARIGREFPASHKTRRLEDVNTCFDEVLHGGVTARLVFDLR